MLVNNNMQLWEVQLMKQIVCNLDLSRRDIFTDNNRLLRQIVKQVPGMVRNDYVEIA